MICFEHPIGRVVVDLTKDGDGTDVGQVNGTYPNITR